MNFLPHHPVIEAQLRRIFKNTGEHGHYNIETRKYYCNYCEFNKRFAIKVYNHLILVHHDKIIQLQKLTENNI